MFRSEHDDDLVGYMLNSSKLSSIANDVQLEALDVPRIRPPPETKSRFPIADFFCRPVMHLVLADKVAGYRDSGITTLGQYEATSSSLSHALCDSGRLI